MSTSDALYLTFLSQQLTIYLGIPIFIAGIIGSLLNTIVFLSLKTFRESSCAFYLTVMAFVNIGQLIAGLFNRIMSSGFSIDWTLSSHFYCKFRYYCASVCTVISFTCMCLATIDQFLATCPSPRWQQWSSIKVAHRMTVAFIILWLIHGIPVFIYYDHVLSPITNKLTCMSSNEIYQEYFIQGFTAIFIGFLPLFINTLFGALAYHNVQHLAYRTVPLVRRELDKQLTVIVLMQTVLFFLATVPYLILAILNYNIDIMHNPVNAERIPFALTLANCLYYLNFASPFYVNICASGRFRQQFIYAMFKMYINRWRQKIVVVNHVAPQS